MTETKKTRKIEITKREKERDENQKERTFKRKIHKDAVKLQNHTPGKTETLTETNMKWTRKQTVKSANHEIDMCEPETDIKPKNIPKLEHERNEQQVQRGSDEKSPLVSLEV